MWFWTWGEELWLNRRETSRDGSGLCTQRARKQTLSRGLCGWEQFLNLVKSSQGWKAGTGQEYLSTFLPWYRKELCLQSPEENLLERMALPNVFSLWWTDIQEWTPPSAHFCTAVAVFLCPPGPCACRSQLPPVLLAIGRPLPLYIYFPHNLYVEILLS